MDIDEGPVRKWVKDTLNIELDLHINHDLRPTQTVAVIVGDRHQINPTAWAKKLLINAQGETVAEKKTFNRPLLSAAVWCRAQAGTNGGMKAGAASRSIITPLLTATCS